MSKTRLNLLLCLCVALVIPVFFLVHYNDKQEPFVSTTEETVVNDSSSLMPMVTVVVKNGTDVMQQPLDTYLVGVLLAEMPARFETEALRAQAVVARTYTMKRISQGSKHDDCDVCTNSACCQAYCSPDQYLQKGNSTEDLEKVATAVKDTSGEVLLYHGEYIEATYFSCSGGRTEDAVAVWGTDLPYLQSVESPGEEDALYYRDEVTFSETEFLRRMGIADSILVIGEISYTEGGGVSTIQLSGITFTGTEVRKNLSLRSTMFTISKEDGIVTMKTMGYGHRVGMSQYGAQAMAKNGKDYRQILTYYYQGTVIDRISGN